MGVVVIIVLGMFIPFVTIVAMPLRAAYRLIVGSSRERLAWFCLLVPWAYFLVPILQHGYVSKTAGRGEGPTVNPWVWILLGLCWYALESMLKKDAARAGTGANVGEGSATKAPGSKGESDVT